MAPAGAFPAPSGPKTGHGAPPLSKFSSMKLALKQKLAHHAASVSALPGWHGRGTVEAMKLTPASAVPVGGVHSKAFYADPEANMWMFKPDKAVRAHAEAAASEVLRKAGIPSVPVYPRSVGGKTGSVQRFLTHTKPLEPHVSSWSQADVDAMVRYHVGSWAIGDHDAKPDNILRTPGGGLVPIDHGQAFKFYGHDKLDTTYHPNGQFGAGRPVYNQAYEAAKKGSLAPGVRVRPEAALPVIAALEAVPDTQYRALLHETAYQGAKQKVSWYDTMRSRAGQGPLGPFPQRHPGCRSLLGLRLRAKEPSPGRFRRVLHPRRLLPRSSRCPVGLRTTMGAGKNKKHATYSVSPTTKAKHHPASPATAATASGATSAAPVPQPSSSEPAGPRHPAPSPARPVRQL